MVVIAASVVTRSGKALVSRQFVEIERARIEGLLSAFPKLVGTGGKQHTFIETATVRYVYQPMDDLYTVIITNKASNILEDLETLQLLTNIVSDQCGTVNEETVCNKAFELVFAFDEVIALGYKEKVNLGQVKQFLEMDSHEEKMSQLVQKNKEREAAEEAKRRMKEIERERKMREKMGLNPYTGIGAGMGGMGYSMGGSQPYILDRSTPPLRHSPSPSPSLSPAASASSSISTRKGLQLKKAPKGNELTEAMKQEAALIGVSVTDPNVLPEEARGVAQRDTIPETMKSDVHIDIQEVLVASLDRDGNLQNMEVRGELSITIAKAQYTKAVVAVQFNSKDVQFKTHPNIDRQKFSEGVIALRDPSRTFPVNTPVTVVKWRYVANDPSALPLIVNCWPSINFEGVTIVSLEYELGQQRPWKLSDVAVKVPIVARSPPKVKSSDGHFDFNSKDSVLTWSFEEITESAPRGNLEFELTHWKGSQDTSHLFPINVSFTTSQTYSGVSVKEVFAEDQSVRFSLHSVLNTERYVIE